MRILRVVAALAVAAASVTAAAADRPCSKADAAAADKAIDRVMTWEHLHKAWQDYRQCDAGATGDLYTDALMRLAVDWKNVDALAAAVRDDHAYHDFVLAHLKSEAAKDDRGAVYSRAKTSCPAGLNAFCGEIAEATKGEAKISPLDLAPMQRLPVSPGAEKK